MQIAKSPAPALLSGASTPPSPMVLHWGDAELAAAQELLGVAKPHSSDLDSLVVQLLQLTKGSRAHESIQVLLPSSAGPLDRLLVVARLLALDGGVARVVQGIQLGEPTSQIRPRPWLRLYVDDRWRGYDPISGEPGMPASFLLLGSGDEPMLAPEGVSHPRVVWSARQV